MSSPALVPQEGSSKYTFTYPYKTNLRIHCGCGEHFTQVVDAEYHAHSTGHTLQITGEIRAQR